MLFESLNSGVLGGWLSVRRDTHTHTKKKWSVTLSLFRKKQKECFFFFYFIITNVLLMTTVGCGFFFVKPGEIKKTKVLRYITIWIYLKKKRKIIPWCWFPEKEKTFGNGSTSFLKSFIHHGWMHENKMVFTASIHKLKNKGKVFLCDTTMVKQKMVFFQT